MNIKLTIPYEPTPKARARTIVRNGRVMSFTPSKTVDAENAIRSYILANNIQPIQDKDLPLAVDMTFYISKPPSTAKRFTLPTKRPDIDNYVKLACDSMIGYLLPDDGQISQLVARKRYGSPPRIEIVITEDKE